MNWHEHDYRVAAEEQRDRAVLLREALEELVVEAAEAHRHAPEWDQALESALDKARAVLETV